MPSDLEIKFNEEMLSIYRRAKEEVKYNAARFLQMVTDNGGIDAAHLLINSPKVSEGYTALWELQRLDLSVEAMVLEKKQYHELFSENELAICEKRLIQYGYKSGTH